MILPDNSRPAAINSEPDFIAAVLDTISTIVVVVDRGARIVRVNRACENLTGYTASELVGQDFVERLVAEDEAATTLAAFEDLRSGHFPGTHENHWVTRTGDRRLMAWSTTALLDASGEVAYVIGAGTDITDRRRLELEVLAQAEQRARVDEALRASEQEFRTLAESMPQHVWTARSDGFNLYVNQRWVDYTGLPQQQGWGKGWLTSVHPDDVPGAMKAWNANAKVNATFSIELRFRRADGVYRWWLVRAIPVLDATGQVVKWFGTSTDIDDLKQAEAALRAKERELAQSLARQQSLSRRLVEVREREQKSLSREMHDRIGQNLSALNINLDLIAQAPPPAADDDFSKRLSDSRALLATTIASVRDLISELRPRVLDDYGLLAGLRSLAQTVATRTSMNIEVTGDETAPRLARRAEAALFRIAQEALNNVCKHALAGSAVLELKTGAHGTSLTIRDDGGGFDTTAAAAPAPRSHWGLLLMQERAEAIGASLRVESVPGRGTQVVVELPKGP